MQSYQFSQLSRKSHRSQHYFAFYRLLPEDFDLIHKTADTSEIEIYLSDRFSTTVKDDLKKERK